LHFGVLVNSVAYAVCGEDTIQLILDIYYVPEILTLSRNSQRKWEGGAQSLPRFVVLPILIKYVYNSISTDMDC
jgi:hypothetical protein